MDTKKRKTNGYWTYERCKEEVSKYINIKELRLKSSSAYWFIRNNKWWDLIEHLRNRKKRNYWTYDKCKEVSLQCTSIKELKKYTKAYKLINDNNWDELTNHIIREIKPSNYWTYERCKEEVLNYKTIKELKDMSPKLYSAIIRNNWRKILFSNMTPLGNLRKRLIYVYIFPDNHFYVGLTCDEYKRNYYHINNKKSPVFKHIKISGFMTNYVLLTDYVDVIEAKELEEFYLNEYINKGYIPLNKAKTGGLGNKNNKWNYEKCKNAASNFTTKSEFYKKNSGAYSATLKNGWIDEFFPIKYKRPSHKWNYETLKIETLKYKTRKDFYICNNNAFQTCCRNGWLNEFFPEKENRIFKWFYNECLDKSKLYKNRKAFQNGCCGAFKSSKRNGWLDEFFPKK